MPARPAVDLGALRRASPWDPGFCARSALFWPLAPAASAFAQAREWPAPADYARAFRGDAPVVSFAPAPSTPRRRRGDGPIDPRALYDGQIHLARTVPTRPRNWHDYLNALVWATFPRAKAALHARQYGAIAARLSATATRLPNARTHELDALALLDEGGLVVLTPRGDPTLDPVVVVFGHALYEHLLLPAPRIRGSALVAPLAPAAPPTAEGYVACADAALAAALAPDAPALAPADLARVDVTTALCPAAWP